MNLHCASCARPLPETRTPSIGAIRFCDEGCITSWFADGKHDRRRTQERVVVERRTA